MKKIRLISTISFALFITLGASSFAAKKTFFDQINEVSDLESTHNPVTPAKEIRAWHFITVPLSKFFSKKKDPRVQVKPLPFYHPSHDLDEIPRDPIGELKSRSNIPNAKNPAISNQENRGFFRSAWNAFRRKVSNFFQFFSRKSSQPAS